MPCQHSSELSVNSRVKSQVFSHALVNTQVIIVTDISITSKEGTAVYTVQSAALLWLTELQISIQNIRICLGTNPVFLPKIF